MAKFQKKKIQDTEKSGFGQYDEGVGGGSSPNGPSKASDHGHGVNSDYRKANNDTMQPRTNDGKFTYKSVNGQSIDPKYGPSRGKTVNPLLTGGENGVMIDDVYDDNGNLKKEGVVSQFNKKSGYYWNKYKDKWYDKGGEMVLMSQGKNHKEGFTTRVSGEAIWEVGRRRYDKIKGEFEGESKVFKEGKKGARSAEEQAAHQKAQATGEEQAVISQSHGGIALKKGMTGTLPKPAPAPRPAPAPSQFVPNPANQPQPSNINVATTNASDIANADYQPQYSDEDIQAVKDILKDNGFSDDDLANFDALSPKEKDDYINKHFATEEEASEEPSAPAEDENKPAPAEGEKEEKEEEDSEAVKKIKSMGFDVN